MNTRRRRPDPASGDARRRPNRTSGGEIGLDEPAADGSEAPPLDTLDSLRLIATGIVTLHDRLQKQHSITLPYPVSLQRGLDQLAALCILNGSRPMLGVVELLELCHRPLGDWPVPLPFDGVTLGQGDRLLDGPFPTQACLALAVIGRNPELELKENQIIGSALRVCRADSSPQMYADFRRLLVSFPAATTADLRRYVREHRLEALSAEISEAYELAPPECFADGANGRRVVACRGCGNLLVRTRGTELRCEDERCRETGRSGQGREFDVRTDQPLRLIRPLRIYVHAPGRAELRLFDALTRLSGLEVELWPSFDAYDLRLVFPGGDVWAVDVKDYWDPIDLANRITDFSRVPPWSRAYFVFPSEHAQRRSDYLTAFVNACAFLRANPDVEAAMERTFLRSVRSRLSHLRKAAPAERRS